MQKICSENNLPISILYFFVFSYFKNTFSPWQTHYTYNSIRITVCTEPAPSALGSAPFLFVSIKSLYTAFALTFSLAFQIYTISKNVKIV